MHRWFVGSVMGLILVIMTAPLMAGEAPRSCAQELTEAKATIDILRNRRESAEASWAHFFVRVRALEDERTQLLKDIEVLKNGAKAPQEPSR